ncbi:30S ribosomal protein S8 [Candidatus Parcubacteria bacterium 4484_255]|nr:MAG: 30S ribosomal protein S8 [Candidatus Parcubacteria bacterium 4484_255]
MTDPIADMLTRMRNALLVKKQTIVFPHSKIKFNIGKILEKENLIKKVEVIDLHGQKSKNVGKNANFKQIKITLKYDARQKSIINCLRKISKPGCRVYVKKNRIPKVLQGFGLAIISTSKGLMTDREAREHNIGGEFICEIW